MTINTDTGHRSMPRAARPIGPDHQLSIVLVQPEIPQNTGNIIRLCAATGASLHLVRPLGFVWNEKRMRRAAMDYVQHTPIELHADIDAYRLAAAGRHWLFSAKAQINLYDAAFKPGDRLVFGSESAGLPETFRAFYPEHLIRIPMLDARRCLNISSAAAIGLYEAIRQLNFNAGAAHHGSLTIDN